MKSKIKLQQLKNGQWQNEILIKYYRKMDIYLDKEREES